MIVLNENQVIESESVIGTTATSDSVFLPITPARGGLSSIQENGLGSFNLIDIGASESGHTAEALKKIQGDPFGAQKSPGWAMDLENWCRRWDASAIGDETFYPKSGRAAEESSLGKGESGYHGYLTGAELSGGLAVGRNAGHGRGIALTDILGQRLVYGLLDGNGIQLHWSGIVAEGQRLDKAISWKMAGIQGASARWR